MAKADLGRNSEGADILWLAQSNNRKTGNVPTAFIGKSETEARKSCRGCAQLKNKNCYAWFGTVGWGYQNVLKVFKRDPQRYSFMNALANRASTARMVRVSAIGDPARAKFRDLESAYLLSKQLKLAFVGYTHFHKEANATKLKKLLMASCDSMEDADDAVARGWRATTIVPYDFDKKRFETPAGNVAVVCPAQTKPGEITCNDCLLCDASRQTRFQVIAFKDHGPKVRNKVRQMKALPMVVA